MVETWLLTKDTFVKAGKLAIEETVFRWQIVEGSNKETLTDKTSESDQSFDRSRLVLLPIHKSFHSHSSLALLSHLELFVFYSYNVQLLSSLSIFILSPFKQLESLDVCIFVLCTPIHLFFGPLTFNN
jgi:hypothetical protein